MSQIDIPDDTIVPTGLEARSGVMFTDDADPETGSHRKAVFLIKYMGPLYADQDGSEGAVSMLWDARMLIPALEELLVQLREQMEGMYKDGLL
jgi:hypothetical protein